MYIPYDWENHIESLRQLSEDQQFSIMYSGGKDASLALSKTITEGRLNSIIHCADYSKKKSLFHNQSISIVEKHAQTLNVPIHYLDSEWWIKWNRLISKYSELKKQGVTTIVFGDLNSRENIEMQYKLCMAVGLKACFPLYRIPYEELITELEKRRIVSIITTINSSKISSQWLGKNFDRIAYNAFKKIAIDPFGENGEFHTTVISADYLEI